SPATRRVLSSRSKSRCSDAFSSRKDWARPTAGSSRSFGSRSISRSSTEGRTGRSLRTRVLPYVNPRGVRPEVDPTGKFVHKLFVFLLRRIGASALFAAAGRAFVRSHPAPPNFPAYAARSPERGPARSGMQSRAGLKKCRSVQAAFCAETVHGQTAP